MRTICVVMCALALMLFSCGVNEEVPLQAEVQGATNLLMGSLIDGDVAKFSSMLAPGSYESGGVTKDERDDKIKTYMISLHQGIVDQYGLNPATTYNAKVDETDPSLVSTEIWSPIFQKMSPKPLYFKRDEQTKKLYWRGFVPRDEKPGVVEQAVNYGPQGTAVWWDAWNQSGSTQGIRGTAATWWWPYVPGCGPGEACNGVPNCQPFFIFPDISQFTMTAGSSSYLWIHSRVYTPYPGHTEYDISMISPTMGNAYCYQTSPVATTSVATNNQCCVLNPYGWDLYWYSGDAAGSQPRCNWLSCPP